MISQHKLPRVAVLYQALDAPVIDGMRKPKKPGGYQDSGADIAYVLQHKCDIAVVTPKEDPDPSVHGEWCFPDTEVGILQALEQGATHLWANTIVFSSHPLQTSKRIDKYADSIYIVGQSPTLVEAYDDKALVYDILKRNGSFTLAKSVAVDIKDEALKTVKSLGIKFPLVAKPVRGRGSHGVKLCKTEQELQSHAQFLFGESSKIIVEEYLSGEEATVTVMPPSISRKEYRSLPIVTRFNHNDGIAPYNGVVAVTANSRTISPSEEANDPTYQQAAHECELVAALLHAVAPIRIDIRRYTKGSKFALFDVNMKPNMTGPGRPGREDQASLSAMAAESVGWDFARLLQEILASATTLRGLKEAKPE